MEDKQNKQQRIIYVEPNDVYDKSAGNSQGDLELTPKYEDFCISFNLIIEQFNRIKTDGVAKDKNGRVDDNGKQKVSIQWGLTQDEMIKRRTSVLSGTIKNSNYNYLTTYYTDLSFESVKKKTEIEGLGVESVQVSYESWYTPTIVIKFVDVRGASIFGREEAIHVDEKLMAENVFGAFFSMPYPLFRLQIKGFYGKPVTYQLTCSSFKGEFNAQTGNFEAVATFIGYSWSLLTDIPFAYLVAAPYATYLGYDYWERHKGTKEWGLWHDGETSYLMPPKLSDLFKTINEQLKRDNIGKPDAEQSQELSQMGNERGLINDLETKRSNFINSLREEISNDYFIDDKNEQILLFHSDEKLELKSETKTRYEEYYEAIKAYEAADFKNGKNITTEKAPNKWNITEEGSLGIPNELKFFDIFKIDTEDVTNSITKISMKDGSEPTEEKLQELVLNENEGKLSEDYSKKVLTAINEKNPHIKRYCYLIDMYDISNQTYDRKKEMEERENAIRQSINESANLRIVDLLGGPNQGGFKPFIGNIFKIIFCHLETFCHIMFDSADEIYEQKKTGQRSPEYLGIDISETDIKDDKTNFVTPWPALFNKGQKTEECGYLSNADIANVFAWVGDMGRGKHNFIEEKVVYALQEGIQHIIMETQKSTDVVKYAAFPILPSDYISGQSVFSSSNIGNVAELSGHLANRIASIFGVLCGNNVNEEMATTLGRLDAYNLFSKVGSIVTFSNIIDSNVTEEILEGIMYCDEKYDTYASVSETDKNIKYFPFETARKIKEDFAKPKNNDKTISRHPFFIDKGDKALYIHFYDNADINYTPSKLKGFNNYIAKEFGSSGDFLYVSDRGNNPYFKPNVYLAKKETENSISSDWLHVCDTTKIPILKEKNVNLKKYINNNMFKIITDSSTVNGIKNKYSELVSGGLKIMEYEVKDDLTAYAQTFLNVSTYASFFENVKYMLSANADKLQLNKEDFLSKNKENEIQNFNWIWYQRLDNKGFKNFVEIDSNCDFVFNGEERITLSELVIQQFKIKFRKEDCNLFGCPFYYMQNNKLNPKENDVRFYNDRIIHSKAYLFLHTFRYAAKTPVVFSNKKTNGCLNLVPKGMTLLLGALLWRRRFANEHKYDPICSKEGGINYYNPGPNYSFFVKNTNIFKVVTKEEKSEDYYSVLEYFGNVNIDYNIENQLISLFEDFTVNTFANNLLKYELKNGNSPEAEDFTANKLIEKIDDYKKLVKYIPNNSNSTEEDGFFDVDIKKRYKKVADKWLKDNLYGLLENYNGILVLTTVDSSCQGFKLLINEDNTEDQTLFKDLYFGSYVLADNCYKVLGKSNDSINDNDKIYVKKSLMKSYLSGFVKASQDIINTQTVSIGNDTNINVSLNTFKNRDLSVSIYYYLKNLWDKWLVISNENAFDVTEFFDKNFVFIDSFYKNVYHYLAINLELFIKAWNELSDNGSVFHFLSYIVDKHGCIFLPVPDYVGFNGETQQHDIEMMNDLFRPLPYNAMEAPSNSNKFIVMFTHSPSHVKTEQNNYVMDSYDLWTHEGNVSKITDIASQLFGSSVDVDEDAKRENAIATREGYNVPSFGIAFARQNNHIFKNLRLTMDNPVMTEQAIKAQWQIALKGADNTHSICFIGQDTFNVFSNYSYSITVEMMGNAQICPLMYFQLLNVPLWKGTYMIYKVEHNMTPGNMITTITAMKMNKFAQPFNTSFFTIHDVPKKNTYDSCDETSGTPLEENGYVEVNTGSINNGYDVKNGDLIGFIGDSYVVGFSQQIQQHFKGSYKGLKLVSKIDKENGDADKPMKKAGTYCKGGITTGGAIVGAESAIKDKCNVIVIHLGINDAKNGFSATTVKNNLVTLVNKASSGGAAVYLCIPIKPLAEEKIKQGYDAVVNGIQQAQSATGCGLIDLRVLQKKVEPLTKKDIHPGKDGYIWMIEEIIKQITADGTSSAHGTSNDLTDWKAGKKMTQKQISQIGINNCFKQELISDAVFARMKGKSYPPEAENYIKRTNLRYLKLLHKDINKQIWTGEMVCHKDIAQTLVEIFRTLYDNNYPIEKMVLIDNYNANDEASMKANNTSCFCYRAIKGKKPLSKHSFGKAIDINPLYNPCANGNLVQPLDGKVYKDRTKQFKYKIEGDYSDLCYRLFMNAGFKWGGSWRTLKDYQHFEK